ncbi:MAG: DUF2231 domain-containing protein [Candidatus Eisenbacteria bacterium]
MLDRLHPFLVHFPIVLLTVGLLLELLRRRARDQAGEWMIDLVVALAAAGALAGALTGDASLARLDLPARLIGPAQEHARAGSVAAWLAGGALLLRLIARLVRLPRRGRVASPKLHRAWSLALLSVAAFAALRARYLGGRLVHDLGVTQATIPSAQQGAQPSPSTYESSPDSNH